MRPLTSLDAFFLASEDGRTVTNVCILAVLERHCADGAPVSLERIEALFAQRLHLLPPLRWRLAPVPLGLSHPWWVDGPVDLEFHVRELALPQPGDDRILADQVARLAARPLDRSRPLWEAYLIHGLSGDRVALLTKLHHAAVDGMSGAEIMSILLDGTPEGREIHAPPRRRDDPQPGQLEMLARGLAAIPQQGHAAARATRSTLAHLDDVPTLRAVPGIASLGRALASRRGTDFPLAPRTRFNDRIGAHRRVAFGAMALDDVKRLKDVHGTTVNDVVVALCAGALRRFLLDAGELPDEPLVTMVPVSVRAPSDRGTFGNKVSTMVVPLPTHLADPLERLLACHDALASAKDHQHAVPASIMCDANDMVPPILFGPAMRTVTRLASSRTLRPAANVVISNVPGSRSPLWCAGALVTELYPVSTIADSLALNITVFSYRDQLNFGLVGDRDLVPDLERLGAAMHDELELLASLHAASIP